MKVRDVLTLEAMQGSEVLAGTGGLDREVAGVNIIEVPDVRRWLRGGEFLFSAGYAFREEPEGLGTLIEELDRAGVSAIGLKVGSYLPHVPKQVLDVAKRLNFPLIRIPPNVPYMDVIDSILRQLTAQRLGILERSHDMGELLTSRGLDDQSREGVMGTLAKELGNPVYVFDFLYGSVLVASNDGTIERHSEESLSEEIWRAGTETLAAVTARRAAVLELSSTRALAASLIVGRRPQGRILVLEETSTLDEFAQRAVSQAAELLSFLLMRRIAMVEGRREASSLFLDSLMSDALSHEEVSEHAVTLGLRLSVPHVAVVIGLQHYRPDQFSTLGLLADQAFSALPHAVGMTRSGRELLVVVETDEPTTPVEGAILRLRELLATNEVTGLRAASGSAMPGLEGVRRSKKEALIAYRTALRFRDSRLLRFEDLGVERLLSQIPDDELTREYVTRVLGPILEDDELLRTLEVYAEHRGNKVAAAAAFPLHRSTLMYRLDKISKLLAVDVDDPERFLELWLAIRLFRILP